MLEVAVLDYGSGNTRSILNALKQCVGDSVELTADPAAIARAKRLVLPGVGAFDACREKLAMSPALEPMRAAIYAGRPFLGICVGMQILADLGEEFGEHPGLGIVPGAVRQLLPVHGHTDDWKLPHVGWTPLVAPAGPLFAGVSEGTHVYFVHSYALKCRDEGDVAASACYRGTNFVAAIQRRNVFGTQFHPEKSGAAGLRLLANFCRWEA